MGWLENLRIVASDLENMCRPIAKESNRKQIGEQPSLWGLHLREVDAESGNALTVAGSLETTRPRRVLTVPQGWRRCLSDLKEDQVNPNLLKREVAPSPGKF